MRENKKPGQSAEPPDNRSDGTKGKILSAALEEFANHGLSGARVDRIALSASVNKAMIYYHFSSKKELYVATLQEFFNEFASFTGPAKLPSVSLKQRLQILADFYYRLFSQKTPFRQLLLRELADPTGALAAVVTEGIFKSGLPTIMLKSLEEGIKSGQLRNMDSRQAMISFVSMNFGYFLMAPIMNQVLNIEDSAAFLEQRTEATVDLFLEGVTTK